MRLAGHHLQCPPPGMALFNIIGAVFHSLVGTIEHDDLPQIPVLTPSPSTG